MATQTQFAIDPDGYLTFNGLTINQIITDRLTQSGLFTDQVYQGSNLTAINQTIAYVVSLLMMYLNQTASETQYTEAQLYENLNRLVKQDGYNPIGFQTATLSFLAQASGLPKGLYKIPRYANISVGGIVYSFVEDIVFAKTTDSSSETLVDLSREKLLYQGIFKEHPLVTAQGSPNELVLVNTGTTKPIDHFNIHVYVHHNNQWALWSPTQTLFLHDGQSYVYHIRLNPAKQYEITFGDGINGTQLDDGDQIAIYYLVSDGEDGQVGANVLNQQPLVAFETAQFIQISQTFDVAGVTTLTNTQLKQTLAFTNSNPSTYAQTYESVEQIRSNAPGSFRSQFRLTIPGDYRTFIQTNFANVVHDVTVVNNTRYVNEYLKYFYDMGITNSNATSRALFNQVQYADACNFNNMYAFVVPKSVAQSTGRPTLLSPALKSAIISQCEPQKIATSETIVVDPVATAVAFGVPTTNIVSVADVPKTRLRVTRSPGSRNSASSIKQKIIDTIDSFFAHTNTSLGQKVDPIQLATAMIAIDGVGSVATTNITNGTTVDGVSLFIWNPVHAERDIMQVTQPTTLAFFKTPYWFNRVTLIDHIEVIDN